MPSALTLSLIPTPTRCIAECLPKGGPPLAWPLTPEQLTAMYGKSPISVVGNVRCLPPSLELPRAAAYRRLPTATYGYLLAASHQLSTACHL